MKKIQINLLSHFNREQFFFHILHYLKKIKPENKEKIRMVIYNSADTPFWSNIVKELNANGIETLKEPVISGSYMRKIEKSIFSSSEYSCSMDDDILINNYLWDYMIENIDILNDDKNLFLAPLISNGIPSVDTFIEDFMKDDDKKEIQEIFKNKHIDNMWGVDYSSLNKHTDQADEWNSENFYDEVSKLNHYYKGIHPVRPSYPAHIKLAEVIIKDFDKFEKEGEYRLEFIKKPYFCNSFYFIKTKTWATIINDKSLFRDGFDEVPLNLYKDRHDLNMVFVRNGFCIHMAYNTIGGKQIEIEKFYTEKLKDCIK